jgi:hypothetical protein
MNESSVLDAAGRRRSPATLPGYHAGRPPRNKGMRYPADPPTVEEIVARGACVSARLLLPQLCRPTTTVHLPEPVGRVHERGRPMPFSPCVAGPGRGRLAALEARSEP